MEEIIEILVVQNHNMEGQKIFYCGESEIEAYKKYKTLGNCKRNIFRAKVCKKDIMEMPFIISYEVLEVLQ